MPTLQANGISIYYETHGEGEPLLLIEGLGSELTNYERIIRALSEKYRVICFDNRGAGRTDMRDVPYSIEMMAEDAAGLLQTLGVKGANVLGISMGGKIAIALTLSHPDLVRSLVLVSTSAKGNFKRSRVSALMLFARRVPGIRSFGDKYPQPNYAFKRQRDASFSYDASAHLGEIHVPTVILHGINDRTTPIRFAQDTQRGIGGSKMVTFNGGHLFPFFRPREFVDAVVSFLDGLGA
jgi:pimeloyl-ACP methyl ester carboxylesterase